MPDRSKNPRRSPGGRPARISPDSRSITITHAPLALKAALVAEAASRGESMSLYVARILAATSPDERAQLANSMRVGAA